MTTKDPHLPVLYTTLAQVFMEQVPYVKWLGLDIKTLDAKQALCEFVVRDEFIGNFTSGVLHGGVTASVLDTIGGVLAMAGAIAKSGITQPEELHGLLSKTSTVDMRVDYLRPARAERFIASAVNLRMGARVAVTRMELHDEKETLLAVGTGTYVVA